MHFNGLDLFFWVAGLAGHLALLGVLWLKRRASDFPVFTALICLYVSRTIVLMLSHSIGYSVYYYLYWSLAVVDVLLQLGVLAEIAGHVFRPAGMVLSGTWKTMLWAISISLAVALGLTALAAPPTRSLMQTVVVRGNFFSSVLMSELFAGILSLSVNAGALWRTHTAQIAYGLGAYSIVGFVVQALQNHVGAVNAQPYLALAHIQMTAYLVCLAFWTVSLVREAPAPREVTAELDRQLLHLQSRVSLTLTYLTGRSSI